MEKKLLTLFIALIAATLLKAQQPVKLITVDSSSGNTSFFKIPGGYLLSSAKSTSSGSVSTVIKTDTAGNPLIAKRINEIISSIIPCSDSGYFMLSPVTNSVIKTDSALNIQWAKKLFNPFPLNNLNQIVEKDGYYYLITTIQSGMVDSTLMWNSAYAGVIHKLDGVGNIIRSCLIADTLNSLFRYNFQSPYLSVSNDGNLYLSGALVPEWASGTCNREPVIVKLDTALNMQWSYIYHVNFYTDVRGTNLLRDGNIALYGGYSNNSFNCLNFVPYLQKIDSAGNVLYAKDYHHTFASSHTTYQSLELADSTLLFSRSYNDTALGHHVAYIDRVSTAGNIINSKGFDWPSPFGIVALRMTEAGNGSVQLARMANTDTLLFTGVDTSLTTLCYSAPNTIIDSAITITRSVYNPLYFNYSFTFNDTIYQPFQSVPFGVLQGCITVGIAETPTATDVNIYPNPTAGNVSISSSHIITQLKITNAFGQLVYFGRTNNKLVTVKLIDKGVYFVSITTGHEVVTKKLLVKD